MGGRTKNAGERSVLLVTYYFPPSGGPGVQRMLKFAKYLPEFGWRPLVLTVREDAAFPIRDETLRRDIPDSAQVVRTGITEFYRFYSRVAGGAAPTDVSTRREQAGWLPRLLQLIRASLFVPDGRVGWIPHAMRPGQRLARDFGARVLLSSGPPFTANLIGGLLQKKTGLPWIQDFRDPWTRAPFYPDRPGPIRRIDEHLEQWTVRNASRTLAVNRTILEDLGSRYPRIDRSRLITIPNGFDEEDFAGIPRTARPKLTLVHSGTLYAARDPISLRTALLALCRQEERFADTFELILAGRVDEEVVTAFRQSPLDRIVQFPGYLPHTENLRLLRSADLCLLLVGKERLAQGMLTGKLFEYLGSGTPILAIAPEGEAAELIRDCGAGEVVDPDDADGLKANLHQLWQRFQAGERRLVDPNRDAVTAYTRRSLTGRLAGILDELSTRPTSAQ